MKHCMLGLALTLLVGCGGGDSFDAPPTHPVSGTIKYNGSAVEGATVMFAPAVSTGGPTAASGITNASGEYKLKTRFTASTEEPGAMAGQYSVTVTKIPKVVVPESPKPPEGASEAEIQKFMEEHAKKTMGRPAPIEIPKSQLPDKYRTTSKSPLSATVPDGGGTFDFDLED